MTDLEKTKLKAILNTLMHVSYTALDGVKELKGDYSDEVQKELGDNKNTLESMIDELFD